MRSAVSIISRIERRHSIAKSEFVEDDAATESFKDISSWNSRLSFCRRSCRGLTPGVRGTHPRHIGNTKEQQLLMESELEIHPVAHEMTSSPKAKPAAMLGLMIFISVWLGMMVGYFVEFPTSVFFSKRDGCVRGINPAGDAESRLSDKQCIATREKQIRSAPIQKV